MNNYNNYNNGPVEPEEPLPRISYFVDKIRSYIATTPQPDNQMGMPDWYRPIVEYYTEISNTSQEQADIYQARSDEYVNFGGAKKSRRKHRARKHKKTRKH